MPAGQSPSGSGFPGEYGDPVDDAFDVIDPSDQVNRLAQDGDQVFLRTVFESKLGVGPGVPYVAQVEGGIKGQFGAQLTVTQVGEGNDALFVVDLEKQTLAALTGRGVFGEQDLKAELGVQPLDSVEMTFTDRDDAIRATQIVQRVAVSDFVSDASQLTTPGVISPGSGSNPAGNPLNDDGAPGYVALAVTDVSADDLAFLNDNVSAYETTIGLRGRLAVEGEAEVIPGAVSFQLDGRLDPRAQVTRRVELPTDTAPGRLSYSVSLDARVSAKEKAHLVNTVTTQNRLELATDRITLTTHYEIPAGQPVSSSSVTNRPLPERDIQGLTPDGFTIEREIEWRDQSFLDVSRGDSNRATFTFDVGEPAQLSEAFDHVLAGDPAAAAQTAGIVARAEVISIERDGLNLQNGVQLDTKTVGTFEATVITEQGFDQVVGVRAIQFDANALNGVDPADLPQFVEPEGLVDDGQTLVVIPRNGLTLRDAAGGERIGVFQNGTFLRQTGDVVVAPDGATWIPVTGTDVADQPVSGFVHADYVQAHPSTRGAMDNTGRVDPELDFNRFTAVTVQEGDNLWDLANEHGVRFEDIVTENQVHLIDPSLIFPGDTVYMPNSGIGPEPVPVPAPDPADGSSADSSSDSSPTDSDSVTTESRGQTNIDGSGSIPGIAETESVVGTLPSGSLQGMDEDGSMLDAVDGSSSPGTPSPDGESATDSSPTGSPSETESPGSGSPFISSGTDAPPISEPGAESEPFVPAAPVADRPDLVSIQLDYQVPGEESVTWEPNLYGVEVPDFMVDAGGSTARWLGDVTGLGILGSIGRAAENDRHELDVPPAERDALNELGPLGQVEWANISEDTISRADNLVRTDHPGMPNDAAFGNDGHVDAVRHTLWNARLTQAFGEDWTTRYATGHETLLGNHEVREAMDLYNNEVGRRIATENPDASLGQLEELVMDALERGDLVVVNGNGQLAWSDQVAVGNHGYLGD